MKNLIRKNLFGGMMSDVDTRSDSTRKGYHEGQASYGANLNFPIFDIMGAVNDELSIKPKTSTLTLPNGRTMNLGLQTGEPIFLPGKWDGTVPAGGIIKTIKVAGNNLRALFVRKPGAGREHVFNSILDPLPWQTPKVMLTYPKVVPQTLKEAPLIKGLKGNEFKPIGFESPAEAGLSVRTARPVNLENPVTNAAERQAAMDFSKATGIEVNTKLPTGRPSSTIELDGQTIDIKYPWAKKPAAKTVKKEVTTVKKEGTAKVTQSERYKDRRTYSKAIRTRDKNARAMEAEKATIRNSGQSGIHNRQDAYDWEVMKKYKEYNRPMVKIESSLVKHAKGTPEYKQAMQRKKDLIARYRKEKRFALGGKIMGMNNIGL